MIISLVVAVGRNKVIGNRGALPWYLPADLRHFKKITLHHSVIMGRTTYESIVARLGRPLPERDNIVLTTRNLAVHTVKIAHSVDEALAKAHGKEVFIIGGAQVYEQVLPRVDRIYMTEVDTSVEGDTFFPNLDHRWHEVSRINHSKDQKNSLNYSFVILERHL